MKTTIHISGALFKLPATIAADLGFFLDILGAIGAFLEGFILRQSGVILLDKERVNDGYHKRHSSIKPPQGERTPFLIRNKSR